MHTVKQSTSLIRSLVDEADEVTIACVAEQIAAAFGFRGRLVFDTSKADGQYKKTASNAKLRSLLPDFQFTEFAVAVRETVQWYIDNQTSARQ